MAPISICFAVVQKIGGPWLPPVPSKYRHWR